LEKQPLVVVGFTKSNTSLVVKEYTQLRGLYFKDTFAPVVKLTTLHLLLPLAAVGC